MGGVWIFLWKDLFIYAIISVVIWMGFMLYLGSQITDKDRWIRNKWNLTLVISYLLFIIGILGDHSFIYSALQLIGLLGVGVFSILGMEEKNSNRNHI